eukprot:s1622_g12.t1
MQLIKPAADHATMLELHEVTLIDPKPAKIQETAETAETAFLIRQNSSTRDHEMLPQLFCEVLLSWSSVQSRNVPAGFGHKLLFVRGAVPHFVTRILRPLRPRKVPCMLAFHAGLGQADVGKPLADLLVPKIQDLELNPFCNVKTAPVLNAEVVQQHSVLLICESMPLNDLLKWNEYCRTLLPKPVAFLYVRTGGVFGNVFVDFGPSHVLVDANGQALDMPRMSAGEVAFVTGLQTARPGLSGSKPKQLQRRPAEAADTSSLARCSGAAVGGALLACHSKRRHRRASRQAFGKFLQNVFPWLDEKKEERRLDPRNTIQCTESLDCTQTHQRSKEIRTTFLVAQHTTTYFRERGQDLGSSAFDKALQVNLDASIYGSFAEIGAGQEVSRTFLTAGAAAGTVARSLSAYDMQISDVTYGKAKRYVTQATSERLDQMLKTEYDTLEASIREEKGKETRFFAFATTLAAKAYMSNRECEGWVGMTFQHKAGAAPSSALLGTFEDRICADADIDAT